MSLSNAAEAAILGVIFAATDYANIAVNDTTSPATNLYVTLHTGDPGEGGTASTNEATYGGWSRIAVVRTAVGWTISGTSPTQVANAAQLTVPTWTSGATNTLTHFSITDASSGTSQIIYSGALTASVVMSAGNPTATIAAGALVCTLD